MFTCAYFSFIFAGFSLLLGCQSAPAAAPTDPFQFKVGDILFQDLDCGDTCDAIEAVTQGAGGADLSHVAMVSRVENGSVWVIEAYANGVEEVALEQLLARSHDSSGRPKVLIGRLRAQLQPLVPLAVSSALRRVGRPYDEVFLMGDDAHYCSELLYEAFAEANAGTPVFSLAPMTFVDPKTGQPAQAWKTYFARLGKPIPEGAPGLNPGGMSRSNVLTIVHALGSPTGWSPSETLMQPTKGP